MQDPTERVLSKVQADRLAGLTGRPYEELVDRTVAQLSDELKWQIDPNLFRFERVCGQVVKVDPATGLKYPVANATVDVRDVVCDWYWFFPIGFPWSWAFPLDFCRSEEVTRTTTDSCGNFCVWIPRFDIEWVLRWRRERICFPYILRRPTIGDVLTPLLPSKVVATGRPTPPNPPDPAELLSVLASRPDLVSQFGAGAAEQLRIAAAGHGFGASANRLNAVLSTPSIPIPPPVPASLRTLTRDDAHQAIVTTAGGLTPIEGKVDLTRPFGPFERCFDIEVPEWVPVFEVPDIVFVVSQTTASGGTQVIYDGAFDVDWGFGTTEVELDVAPYAIASPTPGCVQPVACENEASIYSIGLMGIDAGYFDEQSGFALLMNQPEPNPISSLSTAPFAGGMQVYGCTPRAVGEFYRVMAAYADSDGLTSEHLDGKMQPLPAASFTAANPVSATWQDTLLPPASGPINISPVDGDGWYRVRDDVSPEGMILQWEPIDGVHQLHVQMGNGVPGAITAVTNADSPTLTFAVDSSRPVVNFVATGWRYATEPATTSRPFEACRLIERTAGLDVVVDLSYNVTAKHLFTVDLTQGGCGTATVVGSDPAASGWRYSGPFDNSLTGAPSYLIPGTLPSGCYTWTLTAYSRAISPEDPLGPDINSSSGSAWNADYFWLYSDPQLSVAVVDKS